jgi:hypothetical protein
MKSDQLSICYQIRTAISEVKMDFVKSLEYSWLSLQNSGLFISYFKTCLDSIYNYHNKDLAIHLVSFMQKKGTIQNYPSMIFPNQIAYLSQ